VTDSPVARPEIREAITVLRDAGITASQYATIDITEHWTVSGSEYPDRAAAFAAGRDEATRTGKWAEVWVSYGPDYEGDESWIIEPGASS
jgi:hypothetical protein